MKKLTLFLVAIFAMVNAANAQRAWAYDLGLTSSGDSYTFTFKAVTAGDATLVFYKEGVEAGTLDLGSVSAGANTVTKTSEELLAAIQQSGDFTWGVKMSAGAIAAGTELKQLNSTLYYNMMGIVADVDPESEHFGKVYMQMSYDGKPTYGTTKQTQGFFIYDPIFNLISTPNVGIKPTLPTGYTFDGTNRLQFHRVAIDPKTGNLAFCYSIANKPGVFSIGRNNLTGEVTNLLAGVTGIENIKRTNALCFDEDGALYIIADVTTLSSTGNIYKIVDGVATKLSLKTPSGKSIWIDEQVGLVSDGRGGLWVAQNRSGITDNSAVFHVNVAKDTVDFVLEKGKTYSDWFTGGNGNNCRGGIAYNVKENVLATHSEDSKVSLFKVTYDEETGVPTITKWIQGATGGKNTDAIAFDYAGDLYTGNSSGEYFRKFEVPTTNNTCTVPAKKSQVITLVAPSIALKAHPVKDYSASIVGTMKRAIQNGENTIVLTHEDNGTPHIYSIAHATKTITEISQEGVIARDPENLGDYLSISDIALTDDGKLIASNYMRCEQGTTPATGYKVGEIRYYIWDDITSDPTRWFTTNRTANSTYADVSYTFAIKGTSTNAQLMSTAVHNNNRAARINLHTVVNGTESAYHRFGLHTTASEYTEAKQGVNFQLTATPLDNIWTLEGELTDVTSFAVPATAGDPYTGTAFKNTDLGKKYNGVSYLANYNGRHLMVAPYADGDGKLAGVKVLDINNGFAAAIQITTSTDLTSAISATAAAATAYVDGDGDLTIYLFADSKVYAFSEKEYTAATYTVTATANEGGSVEGGGTYDEGATATVTASPAEHYDFVNWTEGGEVVSTTAEYSFTVTEDVELIANFAKKQYTLTVFVNDENKGTIDVATGSYEYGTEVTLTATPKPDYKLLAWSNKATTPSITLTMDNNKAVSAYFVKEYANEPTFTIEKVWENTINIPGTGNGYQAVGWDGKIYMQDAGNKKIKVFSNDTEEATEYAAGGAGQQIAVDEAGNLIVFNATFHVANPNAILIYKEGTTTGKEVSFTLPQPGRCDFFTASGDIYSAEGGYIYFYCNGTTVVNRLKITNGAATAADVTTDVICANLPGAGSQSNVIVDIFGNIHVESKNKTAGVYNITNLAVTNDTHLGSASKSTPTSTIGGCTFELGGKEWWAYLAGTTNYSSEWQLYNETDGSFLSNELYLTATKTTVGATANWLNAQVVDEKTAYIYQFCPKVGAAVWKVTMKENYLVSATATNGIVSGAGTYQEGATATLTVTPNTGYKFVNWTKDGVVVSTDATYVFDVTEDVELAANFEAITNKTPRAWAYDMKLGEDGDSYTFTFNATADGQATISFKDKDGNALAQPASQTMAAVAGENKFTIAKNAFAEGVDAFWSITMDGAPIEGVVEVTDQTLGIYDFYNMMGVVVDNNTDSKDFGKIYIQQSYQRSYASSDPKNDGITNRSNTQTSGLFIYDQELNELNPTTNAGIKPTMPSGYTEIGSSSKAFQRLNIHPKTGNLVFSHAIEGKPAVFAINRDDMTGAVTNLLTGVADMTQSVAHCFDADGTLFVMDFAGSKGAVYKVINGEATRFTEISDKFINAYITIASDGRGGLWVSQNRGQIDAEPYPAYYQLAHVTSTGEFDWVVNRDTPHGLEGSSSRGALAYDAERQILAQGRNGKVELYTVSYEPTITLTPLHTIASDGLGNNIDGLAFDYAGDLYVVNSSKEKFQKFTLPTLDNICTVAAPATEAIRSTPLYTITVESNNNEWGIVSGGGIFEEGQKATINAIAATNYKFVNWTKDGAEVSTEKQYTFDVTGSANYVAYFVEKTKHTIIVTINDENMGTVEGAGTYYEGTEVALTAKANDGYVFVNWGDGNTNETRTFTAGVDMPETLTANFKAVTYTLITSTNDENKGTVSIEGECTHGSTVTLTATAQPGYKLLYWSDRSTENPRTITMTKNEAISAYFVKEYAEEPTFTITKMWENTNVPASTNNGYQAVGWDGKIYMKDRLGAAINVYTETGSELYVESDALTAETDFRGDQAIAIDGVGNIIIRSGSGEFFNNPTQVTIYKNGEKTGRVIDFTLPATGRCDFISASGDIYSAEGGYVYFYCQNQTTVSRLYIKNGGASAADISVDKLDIATLTAGSTQSHVFTNIFGDLMTHTRDNNYKVLQEVNVLTGAVSTMNLPNFKKSTLGGCSFELGGKELIAYNIKGTDYNSEWNLYNMTDKQFLSAETLYAKDKVSKNSAANWLNVQVVDENTAYIYQFCPTVAVAVWKVTCNTDITVTIGENADNTTALTPYKGKEVIANVTRNFGANKILTLTLPFDMDAVQISQHFGNATVYEFYKVVDAGEELHLQFSRTTSLEAGKPYLIQTTSGYDAEDGFTIENVVISTELNPVKVSGITMVPVLDAGGTLDQPTQYYLSKNALYCAGEHNQPLLGLRAFFTSDSPTQIRARVTFNNNEETSIPVVTAPENNTQKVIKDGRLIIIRGEQQYNAQGQIIE